MRKKTASGIVKSMATLTAAVAIGLLHAASPAKNKPKLSEAEKAERRAVAQKRVMEMHGGILENKGKGAMAVINCQKRIDVEALEMKIAELRRITRMEVKVVDGTFTFNNVKIPDSCAIALYIVDDGKLPMSLVSLESKWGMMNVSPLISDSPDEEKLNKRFQKQFVRMAILTFGGGVSQYRGSPLQPCFSAVDLDDITGEGFTIDTMNMFLKNLGKLGMTQTKRATYRKACEEGWAPAPTNEYQKAIWERVKADKERGPTNPLKIPMPKRK